MKLFIFDIDTHKATERRRFYRRLCGSSKRVGGKVYEYPGLLASMGGWRWVSKSALMVEDGDAAKVRKLFNDFSSIKWEEIKVESSRKSLAESSSHVRRKIKRAAKNEGARKI